MRTALAIALVAIVVVTAGSMTASSQQEPPDEGTVLGSPDLAIAASNNTIEPGTVRTITLTVANAGSLVQSGPERFEDRVTTARNVRIEIATDRLPSELDGALRVDAGSALVASIPAPDARTVDVELGVARSVPPGQYEIPVRVTYEYTSFVRYGPDEPEYNDAVREVVLDVPLVVADNARLAITNATTTRVTPGEGGTLTLAVTNTGTQPANNVALSLRVDGTNVHFGGKDTASADAGVFLGGLDPGETERITLAVGAYAATTPGTYLVTGNASYVEPGGFLRTQDDLRAGLTVRAADESNRIGQRTRRFEQRTSRFGQQTRRTPRATLSQGVFRGANESRPTLLGITTTYDDVSREGDGRRTRQRTRIDGLCGVPTVEAGGRNSAFRALRHGHAHQLDSRAIVSRTAVLYQTRRFPE